MSIEDKVPSLSQLSQNSNCCIDTTKINKINHMDTSISQMLFSNLFYTDDYVKILNKFPNVLHDVFKLALLVYILHLKPPTSTSCGISWDVGEASNSDVACSREATWDLLYIFILHSSCYDFKCFTAERNDTKVETMLPFCHCDTIELW